MLNFSFDESTAGTKKPKENKIWPHLQLDWLRDDKRKDANGNPISHPNYNPRSLYVPDSFKKTLTPASRQWWEMKSSHYDSVLFFKVGKFYELYHMDAVIGVNELNLTFMKGDYAHSGFPEIAYGRFSSALIERGYKVARVEQTETPLMMEERCKKLGKANKFDKVVNREICSITSKGTQTFNFLDGRPIGAGNNYLLSITEKHTARDGNILGVCFVDTSIGKFNLGQFEDDRHDSRLRTLIAHFPPVQVLYDRDNVTAKTLQIFNGCLSSIIKEALRSGTEFWDSSKTIKFLTNGGYFADENEPDSKITLWPESLKKMLNPDDPLSLSAAEPYDLAIKALGGCVWYLHDCFKEEELLTMRCFEEYIPADYEYGPVRIENRMRRNMVLDSVTLRNLEILENSSGTTEGSLLETMDGCSTRFGKRLFRHWLCAPSCDPSVIEDRLNAVENLRSIQDVASDVAKMMKKLPDLERLLSKIHTQGSARRSKSHPDSRAIFFEDGLYSKRKISDLLSALQGFKLSLEIIKCFEKTSSINSEILKQCVTKEFDNGHFPDLKNTLDFFDHAFDHEKAKRDGKIIPNKGVDEEFDTAELEIKEVTSELDKYLEEQKRHFCCKVSYFGSGKNRFQLEVPESATKHASEKYELQSQKKGFKRYWTSNIKQLLAEMVAAEDHRNAALKDIMRRIFANFDKNYKKWEAAVQCLSELDVFLSLMQYSISSQVSMCRPEVSHPEDATKRFLEIKEGRHPSLLKHFDNDFIPNNVCIGGYDNDNAHERPLVLVTGPNMGGKSTLMRQVGLLAVMAQMGSYVPADKCHLTAVDRIFTRLGASDRIMMGESTFFVELSETATILQHATKNSLVILDELGRGTATYDGTAIACSVVRELSTNISCLTLFSTHYHCLVDEFLNDCNVRLGHMACMVENENEDPTQETITFLYKFKDGACPKSYGFNAARLAGIPDDVIRSGSQKSKQFEEEFELCKVLRLMMTCANVCELRSLQSL